MASFLLIHGAWHGAWCWERVVPLLRAAGHAVIAPDLPAHGADRTPWWRATLGGYARRVCDAARLAQCSGGPDAARPAQWSGGPGAARPARCSRGPGAARPAGVIAVGHSMGGLVMTEAAVREPERFAGLVYLCAFAPLRGESLLSLGRSDAGTRVPAAARWGLGTVTIRPERARAAFYQGCAPADAAAATARLCPTPIPPLFQGVSGAPPRGLPLAYLECSEDRAIPIALQRRMHRRFAMERVVTLEADHSPFLGAPEALAAQLDALAAGWRADQAG